MRYGRLPAYPFHVRPRVRLGPALRPAELVLPDMVDYLSEVDSWPMYGNDRAGDCTFAAAGHMIEAWSRYGRGATVKVSEQDIITGYSALTGYDPVTGAHDDGAAMQDVLDYWRKVGIGGHRILGFAEVDVTRPHEIAMALYLFGHVYVGLAVPASAEAQFAAGQPWDVVSADGGIQGLHAVDVGVAQDAQPGRPRWEMVTWARRQQMTEAFWARYVEEAWVVADEEWVSATGGSPPGLDTAMLNVQFLELTGRPGPFPVGPAPQDPADAALAAVARPWVAHHHTSIAGNRRMQAALKAWLAAKKL